MASPDPATDLVTEPLMAGLHSLVTGSDGEEEPLLQGDSQRPHLERQQGGGRSRNGAPGHPGVDAPGQPLVCCEGLWRWKP